MGVQGTICAVAILAIASSASEGFIADFRCHERRHVVEVDSGQPAYNLAYDERRNAKMGEDGYRVIRWWNPDVLSNIDGVLEAIHRGWEKDPAPPP